VRAFHGRDGVRDFLDDLRSPTLGKIRDAFNELHIDVILSEAKNLRELE
jgi:hypothetical protein